MVRFRIHKYCLECLFLLFPLSGDRYFYINNVNTQVEFKSRQWFGATVRSHGNSTLVSINQYATEELLVVSLVLLTLAIFDSFPKQPSPFSFITSRYTLFIHRPHVIMTFSTLFQACAPRYYWRTEHNTPFADATGTCFLSVDSLKTFVEYAPCRTGKLLQQ